MLARFFDFVIRSRVVLLVICVLVAGSAVYPAFQLKYDRRIEGMFPEESGWLKNYQERKQLFGELDTCYVAYADAALISAQGLRKLDDFARQLQAKVQGIRSVVSIARARRPSAPFDSRPLHEQLQSGDIAANDLRRELVDNKIYSGTLIDPKGQTAVLICSFEPESNGGLNHSEIVAQLRKLSKQHDPPAYVAGEPALINDTYDALEEDGRRLSLWSSVLLMAVVAVVFRNLIWVLLPIAVVHITIVWTKGLLVICGAQLSMVSSPLVALITVIGVVTVVHVAVRFREQREGQPPLEAMRTTLATVGPAIFWTCLTTAAGFGALMASRIVPVQNFGLMMALGSGLVFVAVMGIVPAGVLLTRRSDPRAPAADDKLNAVLMRTVVWVERHPWSLLAANIVVLTASVFGCFRLEIMSDFTENFHESSAIVRSYKFITNQMGAADSFDILVDAPREVTDEYLDTIRTMQRRLESISGVMKTVSVIDLLDLAAGKSGSAGELSTSTNLTFLSNLSPELFNPFWNRRANVLRMIVQVAPQSEPAAKRRLIRQVERTSSETHRSARAAGGYILMAQFVKNLSDDQWRTFGLAVACLFVLMLLAFRRWQLAAAALFANAVPILLVVGLMGWVGLPMNVATAMLASVSIGLSVDFSIHYLYRFRKESAAQTHVYDAMRTVHRSVGRAMVLATFALVVGFSVLTISNLIPTIHFGILVSVAMFGGLAGNLVILPLLLRWIRV